MRPALLALLAPLALGASLLVLPRPALGGATPAEVLVVVNDSSAISQAIGAYYAAVRAIPAENVFHLPAGASSSETISRTTFNVEVRDALIQYLSVAKPHLKDQVLYIVLTKGVPLRISGATDAYASVESELCLLFTGLLGDTEQSGWINNPYFNKNQPFSSLVANAPKYLLCRLDGYETPLDTTTGVPVDVKGLIDRAQSPATSGAFLLDKDSSKSRGYASGNNWLDAAATTLGQLGQTVVLDGSTTFVGNQTNLLGYASWGSNDCCTAGAPYYGEVPAGSQNVYPGTFVNGALTTDYVSTNGRTFLTSATYGQSLVADLIRLGATGCAGHVFEPYLNSIVRPQVLFPRFLTGYDAIEAFYMGMPFLSWQNTVVVDPLMKSGVIVTFPPAITSVFPDRDDHAGGKSVFVFGDHLGTPGDPVTVTFGGVPSPNASFIGANVVQAIVPPGSPGRADVGVTVTAGVATFADGFLYLPALELGGSTSIGQTAQVTVNGKIGDGYLLYLGSTPATLPIPPHGMLLLDPTAFFVPLLTQTFPPFQDRVTLSFPIPNNPNIVGVTAYLQAAVGDLVAGSSLTYFSNRIDLMIAP